MESARGRRRIFLLLLGFGGAVGIGCTALSGVGDLKSGEGANTSGGGTTTVTLPDGAVVVIGEDGGIISSSSSSSSSSGNPITDGAITDVAADGPVVGGYCASQAPAPTLCTDFDDGVFPGPWTPHATAAIAANGLDSAIFRSGNRSAHFTITNTPAGGASYLSRTFAQMVTASVRVGFSVRPANVQTGTADYELMTIHLGGFGVNAYEMQLERVNGQLRLEEETPLPDGSVPETNRSLGIASPLNQWMRIDVTIALTNQSSTVTVAAEGSLPQTFPASAHQYNTAPPRIFIGYDTASTTALDIHFDDIVVDIK